MCRNSDTLTREPRKKPECAHLWKHESRRAGRKEHGVSACLELEVN